MASSNKIRGTKGNDLMYGTGLNDLIDANLGDDIVYGGNGNDEIHGSFGNDTLYGDAGNDKILGGKGNDKIFGGLGNDNLFGDYGDDELNGNEGDDIIGGGPGADILRGESGNDKLMGGPGADILLGGAGNDELMGAEDNDQLFGGGGNDKLTGSTGNDLLKGELGNDILNGGKDNDTLYGGDGNDQLLGSDGDDVLYGDAGDDMLDGGLNSDTYFGGTGTDTARIYGELTDFLITVDEENGTLLLRDLRDEKAATDVIHSDVEFIQFNQVKKTFTELFENPPPPPDDPDDVGSGGGGGGGNEPPPPVPPVPGTEKTYIVSKDGSGDFTSIQAAINASKPGDTVIIKGGIYDEAIKTKKHALEEAKITIKAAEGEYVEIFELKVTKDHHVFEGITVNHKWAESDAVQIGRADHITMRGMEIKNGMRDGIDIADSNHILLENMNVHHFLKGTFETQQDAHAIVASKVIGLTVRDSDLHHVSGDLFQADPNRGAIRGKITTDILFERVNMYTSALDANYVGWKKGEIPGENAIDTKVVKWEVQAAEMPESARMHITVKDVTAWGFVKGDYINNRAVFNMKEMIEAVFDNVKVFDSEIAFRVRGGSGNANVTILNSDISNVDIAVRAEDNVHSLAIHNTLFGENIGNQFRIVAGNNSATWDIINNYFMESKHLVASDPSNTLFSGQNLFEGDAGNNSINGNTSANLILGDAGQDILNGLGGADIIYGGAGNDILDGGVGADLLNGGDGVDTVTYGSSNAGVTVNLATGAASGGAAAGDVLLALENVIGSAYADNLTGDEGANKLFSSNGNDVINGAGGADLLAGGLGADRFVYLSTDDSGKVSGEWDKILDFNKSQNDLIDLSAFAGTVSFKGTSGFVDNGAPQVNYTQNGGNTFVHLDVDGNKVVDMTIELTGLHSLTQSDFVL